MRGTSGSIAALIQRRLAPAVLLLLAIHLPAQPTRAATAPDPGSASGTAVSSPLAAPGNYSLAPQPPGPQPSGFQPSGAVFPSPLIAGGEVSQSFGSNGYRSTSMRLDSGPIGGNTHAFVAVGTGQGPHWKDQPTVTGSSVAAGIETDLGHGFSIGVAGGEERDRFSGHYPGWAGSSLDAGNGLALP